MKTYYCCLLLSERYIFFLHLSCGCLIHLHSWLQHALCVWGTLSSNPICQPLFRLSGITTGEENSSVSALCVCVCVCRVYSYCLTAPLPHWCETIYCLFLWLAEAQKPLSALASIFWISSSGVSTSSEDKHYGWFLCLFFFCYKRNKIFPCLIESALCPALKMLTNCIDLIMWYSPPYGLLTVRLG